MAIINHNSISGVTTVSVGSSIVVGDTFVITSNGLENITQISATGVITATSFSGALTGNVTGSATALSGTPDVTVGTLNATDAIISGDLTVQGTTTTLDTVVTEVDKLEVDANNTNVAVAVTQSGTGDILRLYDGATQAVTVKDGGSVGIGTDNPAQSLHVFGSTGTNIQVQQTSGSIYLGSSGSTRFGLSSGANVIQSTSADFAIGSQSGNNLVLGTNNTERLRINSSGNVGIGTDNPLTKLDTRGALHVGGGSDGIWLGNAGDNSAYDNVKLYYTGYNSGSPRIYLTPRTQPGSGNVNTYLHLLSSTGVGANNMGLLVDGNVGIGTDNPDEKLEVYGGNIQQYNVNASGGTGLILHNYADGGGGNTLPYSFIRAKSNPIRNAGEIRFGRDSAYGSANEADSHISFWTAENDTNIERLRITSGGNVGIGTDSPSSYYADQLVVDIGSSSQNGITIKSGPTAQGIICFADGTSGTERYSAYIDYHHDTNVLSFGTNSGNERFRLGPAGQFGIGGAFYGSSGQVLTSQGSSAAPQWATLSTDAQSVAILTDVKTQGTTGGTFTSGAWQVRDLNTEAYDPDGIVTLSSNQFTLVSGTYYVWWSAPGYSVTRHQSRLWNVNGNNQEELGDSVYTPTSVQVPSQGAAIISNGTYRIEHRCQTTQSNNGFGVEANFTTERYTRVVIIKIG